MNIIELNTKLYNLFEQVEKGEVDPAKAQAMIEVSNTIINNTKVIVSIAKAAKSKNALLGVIGETQESQDRLEIVAGQNDDVNDPEASPDSPYELKSKFAKKLGYESLSEAVSKLGNHEFNRQFNLTLKA